MIIIENIHFICYIIKKKSTHPQVDASQVRLLSFGTRLSCGSDRIGIFIFLPPFLCIPTIGFQRLGRLPPVTSALLTVKPQLKSYNICHKFSSIFTFNYNFYPFLPYILRCSNMHPTNRLINPSRIISFNGMESPVFGVLSVATLVG